MENLLLDPADENWVAFVESCPDANIFHHRAWTGLLAECYGYRPFVVAVADPDGTICAGLPVMEVRSPLTGRRWVSLPYTDHCRPLYRDADSLAGLTEWLAVLSKYPTTPRIELRWGFPPHPAIHPSPNCFLHTLALDPDAELVAKGFQRQHRQNIRTAERNGVYVECGAQPGQMDQFYRLQVSTRQRHGVPVQPRRYFKLVESNLIDQGMGFVLTAHRAGECIAAAVFLHWNRTIMCKYAASRADSLKLRPNDLLFWTGIRWGCENGYRIFDMGRSDADNSGLQRFKRGWGAEEEPLTYCVVTDSPPSSTNTSDRMMSIMESVIKASPEWVCRATGELLYRHFG
jgi:CelD/BcsL family acetyltransferase involved in cellulose biosynthesis